MVNSSFGSIYSRSNGLVNSDLSESWWTCLIYGGHVFGPFGYTKGGHHKHELTKFSSKLELRRALLKCIKNGETLKFLHQCLSPPTLIPNPIYVHPNTPTPLTSLYQTVTSTSSRPYCHVDVQDFSPTVTQR